MFTYLTLRNFMSFGDVTFDFKDGKSVKSFVSVYGENGSGKSNFVNAFDFLYKSLLSFRMAGASEYIRNEEIPKELLNQLLLLSSFSYYLSNARMIDSEEDTYIEVGFQTQVSDGYYCLSFRDRIVYEKLYYFSGKQKGTLFELKYQDGLISEKFHKNLFKTQKAKEDIVNQIEQYWGKNTLLSIFQNEREKKNESYINDNYLSYLYDYSELVLTTNINLKNDDRTTVFSIGRNPNKLVVPVNLNIGTLPLNETHLLDVAERILKDFFTQTYADIKDVYYTRDELDGEIKYKLYIKKMISNRIRDIDFDKESGGTKRILKIINSLFSCLLGDVVIFDEIDDGIHDLLLSNILSSLLPYIDGQLIITTHNTFLMEHLKPKNVYVINSDYMGNKTVNCLNEYRIGANNNIRNLYMKGMFGGIPVEDPLDFDEIVMILNDENTDYEGD